MSIIRTDAQTDALEILKLIIQTVDFYRAMGEELSKENIHHQLFDIAERSLPLFSKSPKNWATYLPPPMPTENGLKKSGEN